MYAAIMIDVSDVESSSGSYQRLLGCRSGHGGVDFEMLMHEEDIVLMLHRAAAEHHQAPPPTKNSPRGVGVCIYIRVDDIHAIETQATAMGLEHQGVRFNERAHQDELEIRDPDGYFLTICGPTEWASPP